MTCGVCGQRKARRACPALQRAICPGCCGSKRLVEIDCPADCVYLATAQQHPAAAVLRRHQADLRQLLAATGGLTESQFQLFFLIHTALSRFVPDGGRLLDADVAEATASLAANYQTTANGVIAESLPAGSVAHRLSGELRVALEDLATRAGRPLDPDITLVLRAVERGARSAVSGPTAYLELVARVLREGQPAPPNDTTRDDGPKIVLA